MACRELFEFGARSEEIAGRVPSCWEPWARSCSSSVMFVLGILSLTALILSQNLSASPRFPPGFGFWVMVLVLSSFVLLGGGGVIWTVLHASATRERRSSLARRAANLDLRGSADASDVPRAVYSNIPSDANLTNSPGVKLSYRLPVVQSPAWRLIFASVFGLIWNISAAVLAFFAMKSVLSGRPEWFLVLFMIPFVAVGAWLVRDFVRQMLIHTGIGPTQVEISDHPLRPSAAYQVYLSQGGHLSMRSLCAQSGLRRGGHLSARHGLAHGNQSGVRSADLPSDRFSHRSGLAFRAPVHRRDSGPCRPLVPIPA